ncbi:MAG TPA: AAA family ATPase [Candidatus Binatia bacterium]|nr:AAA family ATPase [Candidatus Binatia bacterium]
MTTSQMLTFAPFRLDPVNARLWREEEFVPLRPKPFAVLRYLAENPGRLVTKEELNKAVWPDTYVGESSLKGYIRALREVLADDPEAPRFIETVARRGYRFIALVHLETRDWRLEASPPSPQVSSLKPQASTFVGREQELAQLQGWLGQALHGKRHLVFVTGDPGLGKTTVVDAFLRSTSAKEPLWVGQGQCIEHYGAGEAYLPVLEALGHLARTADGEQVVAGLRRYAPTWLAQMPAVVPEEELEAVQRKVQGVTRERMLREMAEALEALAAIRPVVLWLEDLQWSDYSTLDLLASVARRRGPARLFIIGTYRPTDVIVSGHPLKGLKQELQLHRQCEELALLFLSETEVAQYLGLRFPQHQFPVALAHVLHHSTEGNPLFLVNVVDELLRREAIAERERQWALTVSVVEIEFGVPESLRQMIEQRVERLTREEQRLLEVASVAGATFSAATAAAGLEEKAELVEEQCDELVRRGQFLRAGGTESWPDGTVTACYAFQHALYQSVLYGRPTESRRLRLHQRIGVRLEEAYGGQARELAAELAMHFERGRDYQRAVRYLGQAGENAIRRSAYVEAVAHLTKGLELLKTLPDTPERIQQELALRLALSDALLPVKGYTAPDVEKPVLRARELCQQTGETPQLFPVLWRLWMFYHNRRELQTSHEFAEQLMRLAQSVQGQYLFSLAHGCLGCTLYLLGELTSARPHLEQSIALYDPQQHPRPTLNTADPRVDGLSYASWTLWLLGYPDQALQRSQEAVALAERLSHPWSVAYVLGMAAWFHFFRGEGSLARERAEAAIALSTEQGFPTWLAHGTTVQGWALVEQGQAEEGIPQIQQGLAAFLATGAKLMRPSWLALLAEAYRKVGRIEEGLSVLAEALAVVDKTGERVNEAELHRLKGLLTLRSRQVEDNSEVTNPQTLTPNPQVEAEACFLKAVEIARKQSAKSLELRAAMSLSRLWLQQGKPEEAHQMLAEIYGWFTEGFDTKDLQETKALLAELNH